MALPAPAPAVRNSRRRRLAAGLALLVIFSAGIAWRLRPKPPLPPLELGIWYWHQPFALKSAEADQLKAVGIRQLFLRAGTFRLYEHGVSLALPERFESGAEGLEVHLVFNFDPGIVRHFESLDNADVAKAVAREVSRLVTAAASAGIPVSGIQLDMDCPTRLLPKYASLLAALKPILAPKGSGRRLSITALPTWFTSDGVRKVMEAADFTVPQYYEARIPKSHSELATLSEIDNLSVRLKAAERTGRPFYAGIPAYGHALIFDERGRLLGTFSDFGAVDALRHPSLRLERGFASDKNGRPASRDHWIGEHMLDFVAVQNGAGGRGKGYHIVYDLPTGEMVRQHMAILREQRPANCLGAILYRFPEETETQALPLPELTAAVAGRSEQPRLEVTLRSVAEPWGLIETGRKAHRPPIEVRVTVRNASAASTSIGSQAVTVRLVFDKPGIEDIHLHEFDDAQTYFTPHNEKEKPIRASAGRANTVVITRSNLTAGESVKAVTVRLPADGPTEIRGEWSAVGPGGYEIVRRSIGPVGLTMNGK